MPLILSILEGSTAEDSEPILVTRDPVLIAEFGKIVAERCGAFWPDDVVIPKSQKDQTS
jgi:hypothetical protein